MGQRDAGVHWLHVHPEHLCDPACWEIVRLARAWREGVLPEAGGIHDQAAMTVAAIEIVLSAWAKMEKAKLDRLKRGAG